MNAPTSKTRGEWTLVALQQAYKKDLEQCTTEHERAMCTAINRREMRDLWQRIKAYRKPTPGEVSVAQYHGFV